MGIKLNVAPFADIALLSEYLVEDIPNDSRIALKALRGATNAIQRYCRQTLAYVEDETIIVDGSGSSSLLLPDCPVVSISEVIENIDRDTTRTLLGPANGSKSEYDYDPDSGLLFRRGSTITYTSAFRATFGKWPDRRRSVQITYTHGYSVGGIQTFRVVGAASNTEIDVPGFDITNGDILLYVLDEDTDTLLVTTPDADGDGFKTVTTTTGHSLLVSYSTDGTIPSDIELVCVAMAARMYAQDGATNETVGSYSATYAGQPATLTADEKRILDQYRKRRK